jgi:cellulose synthase/poly-beta-1,6-N-acetylglucosamine synthase-like glycosyltransferase
MLSAIMQSAIHALTALVLTLLAIPAALASLYVLLATLLSAHPVSRPRSSRRLRFDIIVPAHNEAPVIARTVASLRRLDWPADRFRVLVIADNCTDTTASLARTTGARVIERRDPLNRGKGHALAFAFDLSLTERRAQAAVVVDADTEVSSNLLDAIAQRLEHGAQAVQVHYGVLNADASWRTRLMAIAHAAFHRVRSRARERLRLSCGIRGNGWCVTHKLLRETGYDAFSLAEDLEYGIDLGLAGHRVHYVDEAEVRGEMVSGADVAATQRQRWEGGRFALLRARVLPLLRNAWRRRDPVCLDLALDLLVLPLSYVALNIAALGALALLGQRLGWVSGNWQRAAATLALCVVLYVLRGWRLSGVGARGAFDLARAPLFIVWKSLVMLTRTHPTEWVRTHRERT